MDTPVVTDTIVSQLYWRCQCKYVISRENSDSHNGVNTGSGDNKDKNDKGNSTNGDKNGGPVTPELNISAKSVVNSVTGKA